MFTSIIVFGVTVLLVEAKEVEYREQREKKELEILELTRQLKIQNEEKQNEIIKLQIEVCITELSDRSAGHWVNLEETVVKNIN